MNENQSSLGQPVFSFLPFKIILTGIKILVANHRSRKQFFNHF